MLRKNALVNLEGKQLASWSNNPGALKKTKGLNLLREGPLHPGQSCFPHVHVSPNSSISRPGKEAKRFSGWYSEAKPCPVKDASYILIGIMYIKCFKTQYIGQNRRDRKYYRYKGIVILSTKEFYHLVSTSSAQGFTCTSLHIKQEHKLRCQNSSREAILHVVNFLFLQILLSTRLWIEGTTWCNHSAAANSHM